MSLQKHLAKQYPSLYYSIVSVFSAFLLFFLLDVIFPLQSQVPYASLVLDREGEVLHAFLAIDDKWRFKTELEEISPTLRKAIIQKEDKYFYYHFGINPLALLRAVYNNLRQGKRTSGASTITMQVARLLAPKERTYSNKLIEMWRALQLEWHYSKREILQMYLNLVPYGGNVEGIKAASLFYFDKLPLQLSIAEATTLALIPNRPNSLVMGRHASEILRQRNRWLRRFAEEGIFDEESIKNALREPLPSRRYTLPQVAPHLARRLQQEYPQQPNLRSSLRKPLQLKVEQLVYNYVQRQKIYGIHHAAVLLINNATLQVEAYVGSPDFADAQLAGQVDGVKALRSPGSTLKPLVYALCFEEGTMTPKFILHDVPTDWNGYQPDNFHKDFSGKVSVEKALAQSLNIPAVKALELLSVEKFVNTLIEMDFKHLQKQKQRIGLSMILGGCGVSLEELGGLFAMLANRGQYWPLQYLHQAPLPAAKQILSEATAHSITEVLALASRPDLPKAYQYARNLPKIAWKTGTSYGRRDAWSIGYHRQYTIGVWLGNFSGKGVPELTGAEVATPLLFELFKTVEVQAEALWWPTPKEMQHRLVCAESGLPPGTDCEDQVLDFYLPLRSATHTCEHLKSLKVSEDGRYTYCASCAPASGYRVEQYPNLGADLIAFYESRNIAYRRMPPHFPDCKVVAQEGAPKITSPTAGKEYLIDFASPTELMLACQTENDVKKVYWYINDRFYQEADAQKPLFFLPEKGLVKISCSDDKGRNTNIKIRVLQE